MKQKSLPLNPPRPGPGQFSFEQFLEWAVANNKSPVPMPRFSPYAKPRRSNDWFGRVVLPATTTTDAPLTASAQLEEIMRRKQQEQPE